MMCSLSPACNLTVKMQTIINEDENCQHYSRGDVWGN